MLKILPYKIQSESARDLARALGVKRIIPGGDYRPGYRTTVVNWGCSEPHFVTSNILNRPEAVRLASNKLSTLKTLKEKGVSVPEFTTHAETAKLWQEDGFRVVVRHKLQSHSGQGIQICQPEDELPHAPLYTKYTRKDKEFRVHVFKGRAIDWSEKCRRNGAEPVSTLIRNHANGWVFCREGRVIPQFALTNSIEAVAALGLDFGAVDVIVRGDRSWVLEVNTAPGLEGTTLQRYVEAFRRYL